MCGHTHRQGDGALGSAGPGTLDRPLDRRRIPGNHDLPGGVVIDGLDHRPLRGLPADRGHGVILESEDRGHRTAASRHGLLHRLATEANELDSRGELERARAYERGEFPEAMAGEKRGQASAACPPSPPHGHSGREHRRLRALGGVERLLRARARELPEVVAEHLRGLGEGVAHAALGGTERRKHADRLRALTGEHECKCHEALPRKNPRL